MNKKDMASLLEVIAERVNGDGIPYGNGTAPVELSIGFIARTGMCMHDGIVITSAPPSVLTSVIKWVNASNEDDQDAQPINIEPGCGGVVIR
jgi:hypothetical protein